MPNSAVIYVVVLFCCLFLVFACTKKEEPAQAEAPSLQQPAASAPQPTGGESQMNKAQTLHKNFVTSLSATLAQGDTVDAVRERLDLADKTRTSVMLLRSDIDDVDAANFLVRFTDGLDRYHELGNGHVATLEEVNRLYASGKEMQDRIAKMPDKEKAQATAKLNAVIDQHNALVKGTLAQERKDLEDLGNELMELK